MSYKVFTNFAYIYKSKLQFSHIVKFLQPLFYTGHQPNRSQIFPSYLLAMEDYKVHIHYPGYLTQHSIDWLQSENISGANPPSLWAGLDFIIFQIFKVVPCEEIVIIVRTSWVTCLQNFLLRQLQIAELPIPFQTYIPWIYQGTLYKFTVSYLTIYERCHYNSKLFAF